MNIALNHHTLPLLASVGAELDARCERMVAIQCAAYPDHWTGDEKREMAERHLFGRAAS